MTVGGGGCMIVKFINAVRMDTAGEGDECYVGSTWKRFLCILRIQKATRSGRGETIHQVLKDANTDAIWSFKLKRKNTRQSAPK